MRLPLVSDLKILSFSGATISNYDSGITNGMIKDINGVKYLTCRPPIQLLIDASTTVSDAYGRGIYYWNTTSSRYFVNYDTIYKTNYSTTIGTISTGYLKCSFAELGGKLVVIDPENDEGWTITSGGTLAQISDAQFPSTVASGVAVLDQYLFVLDESGNIWGSDSGDPTSWTALDFINAQRSTDGGTFIANQMDQIVAFGPKSIEFFYDAGNATGSPLSVRKDLYFSLGCVNPETCWICGDKIYFLGADINGTKGVYVLDKLNLRKISSTNIDVFLTSATGTYPHPSASGFTSDGHIFYILTLHTAGGGSPLSPQTTLVYDDINGIWGTWSTSLGDGSTIPIIESTSLNTLSSYGCESILSNGDIISLKNDIISGDVDSTGGGSYSYNALKIRTGTHDFGSSKRKKNSRLSIVGNRTATTTTATVKRSDDNSLSFDSGRTIDLSLYRDLRNQGIFRRRNHEISVTPASSSVIIELEALDLDLQELLT